MNNKAFTLIEMLVAVTIFSLIIGSATGLFVSAIRSQVNALSSQKLLDETSYVMEYMSRALRMAKKDLTGSCLFLGVCSAGGCNYDQVGSAMVWFINYQDECMAFYRTGSSLYTESPLLSLTSNDLEVASVRFDLSGVSQTDNLQPRVTISMTIRKAGAEKPEITIQTTISQRNLDIVQ